MHKYERLEKIYYRKKFFKFLIIVLLLILCIVFIKIFLNINNKPNHFEKRQKNEINFSKKVVLKKEKKTAGTKSLVIKDFNKTKNYLVKKKNNTIYKPPTINFTIPKIEINNTVKKTKKIKINKIKVENKSKNKIKNRIKRPIIIEENIDINTLIKKFENNPSFDLALQISQYYLNKNQLDLAKLWALKANNINPSRYESWKIFAIILIKKHQKEKAKEVLNVYLNDYGKNKNIIKLLRSLNE